MFFNMDPEQFANASIAIGVEKIRRQDTGLRKQGVAHLLARTPEEVDAADQEALTAAIEYSTPIQRKNAHRWITLLNRWWVKQRRRYAYYTSFPPL